MIPHPSFSYQIASNYIDVVDKSKQINIKYG